MQTFSASHPIFVLIALGIFAHAAQATSVRVVNTMGPINVWIHCASGDDDIGDKFLKDKEQIDWSFNDNIFGTTLFWCDAQTSDGRSKHWDVYKAGWGDQHWFLRGDGIFTGDNNGGNLEKKMDW